MKVTGVIPILLLFLINGYVNCQNFEYNNNVHFEDGNFSLTVVFQVEATYNSVTGDVCANGVTNDTANLMCQNTSNLQAVGFVTTDYSTFVFNSVAYSIDCSSGIDTCPGTQVSNCDSYGGLLAVKCVIPIPECYSQSVVMLSNPVNTTIPSGGYYVTGHPVTCSSSGNYVPICNSVNIGPLEIIAICAYTIIGSGGFNGAPSGVTVPPPTLRSSDTVSNQFSCSGSTYSNLNCSGNSIISSCPNGYATVTCQKVKQLPLMESVIPLGYRSSV
uniref:SRCR domain-containing protein n=1 Tax=Amphimedon queenslandica TaxID=400682 RepID=A0A1X7TIX7_AMPQE